MTLPQNLASELQEFSALPGAAIVTGGTGGIGRAICQLLTERGSRVLMTYRSNRQAAGAVVRLAPDAIHAVAADFTEAGAGRAVVDAALERFGAVHTLVHAAGPVVPQVYVSEIEFERFERHLLAEAAGFFNMVSPLLPALRDTGGSIVAVTTVATRRFPARDALSSGPKAAVEALVRALAVEEGRYGIRANCIGPGILDDGMTEQLIANGEMPERALAAARDRIPLGRFGRATEVAEAACFLASPRAAYITGQHLDVDGGYTT